MSLEKFVRLMPKVELHVHLEGSIHPETLLTLAERNHVPIPAHSVEELRDWYRFTDFAHFAESTSLSAAASAHLLILNSSPQNS